MEAKRKPSGNEGDSSAESAGPNPEAIAWYVDEAQRLLEDQQRRAESLRTRGGQVAGFGAAVLALIGGNAASLLGAVEGTSRTVMASALLLAACCLTTTVAIAIWSVLRPEAFATISAEEASHYTTKRFLSEPNLWRVHIRSLHALDYAVATAQEAGNSAARAVGCSLKTFLLGLAFSLFAIATLILEFI